MCVVVAKYFDNVGWVGVKNRDRNYVPDLSFRKKKNKNYNLDGASFCLIIQEYERQIMMAYKTEIENGGYIIGAFIHDGVLIDKVKDLPCSIIESWINRISIKMNMCVNDGYLPYILRLEALIA